MDTRTLIAIIVIALVAIGGYFLISNRAAAPMPEEEAIDGTAGGQEEEPADGDAYAALITYTDGGFSPAVTNIKIGETVRFVNNASRGMWVGADEHPTHTEYDGTATREHCAEGTATGGAFDMCRQGVPGESWDFTFTKTGSFDFHNHAQASHGGTVVVSE